MTYLQRIDWLDKKIEKAKEKLLDVEELHGRNATYRRKEMEIEEYEHLKSWYNGKIIAEYKRDTYRLCRMKNCKYYLHGNCFLGKSPVDNACIYCREE